MPYVDGFLVPVPKKNLATYRRMSTRAGKIWRELGALQYIEAAGDDLNVKGVWSFTRDTKLKPGETLVFAWILYKSKADRDRINKRIMKDPRMLKLMGEKPLFDVKHMRYGGFKGIVQV